MLGENNFIIKTVVGTSGIKLRGYIKNKILFLGSYNN
jgi:hypothetical protein